VLPDQREGVELKSNFVNQANREIIMAHIVIMDAGISGMPATYEMKEKIGKGDKVTR
jgi:hypothetical protein